MIRRGVIVRWSERGARILLADCLYKLDLIGITLWISGRLKGVKGLEGDGVPRRFPV